MIRLWAFLWLAYYYTQSANTFTLRAPSSSRYRPALQERKETLTFSVDYTLLSDRIPAERKQDFIDWFQTDEVCESLLSAGGKRKVQQSALAPIFETYWDEIHPTTTTTSTDTRFIRNQTSKLFFTDTDSKFPGVTLLSTLCNGCNLVYDETGRPQYRFVLLAEKQSVSGSPPVVWLFNKLTGISIGNTSRSNNTKNNSNSDFQKTTNNIKSVASIVDYDDSVAIKFDIDVKIKVVFPKSLLNILPTTKEKMEEQGSASMRTTIVKDVDDAVAGTVKTFLNQFQELPVKR